MKQRFSRRTALKATGGLGIGIASGSILMTRASAGDHTFADELETVRATTRKYRDVGAALSDGYVEFGVFPPVEVIFEDLSNIGNTGHDERPSLLFYAPSEDGDTENSKIILAGLEYHVLQSTHPDNPPDKFDDEGASREFKMTESDGWHENDDLFGRGIAVRGLHVWAHFQNPDGLFAGPHPVIFDRLTD